MDRLSIFCGQRNSTSRRGEMQVCGRLRSVISGEGQADKAAARQTKKKPPTSIQPPVSIFATSPPPGWAHKWQPGQDTQGGFAKPPSPQKIDTRIGEAQFSAAATMSCNFLIKYLCVRLYSCSVCKINNSNQVSVENYFLTFFCHQHILR